MPELHHNACVAVMVLVYFFSFPFALEHLYFKILNRITNAKYAAYEYEFLQWII